ncbi:gfo/Idh/MocA family oxidoreductase [Sesbania bispinosa]|nr:gfo/Idh/MocA family oxidoreductase [Sesbania bispinosa]
MKRMKYVIHNGAVVQPEWEGCSHRENGVVASWRGWGSDGGEGATVVVARRREKTRMMHDFHLATVARKLTSWGRAVSRGG